MALRAISGVEPDPVRGKWGYVVTESYDKRYRRVLTFSSKAEAETSLVCLAAGEEALALRTARWNRKR